LAGCSIHKDQKTIEYLNRIGSTMHGEIKVLEEQKRDGRSKIRNRNGPVGSRPCSGWWWWWWWF